MIEIESVLAFSSTGNKEPWKIFHYTHSFCTVNIQITILSTWFVKYLNFFIHRQKAWEKKCFNWIFCFNQTSYFLCFDFSGNNSEYTSIYLLNRTIAILSIGNTWKEIHEIEGENGSEWWSRDRLIDCKYLYRKIKWSANRTWGGK